MLNVYPVVIEFISALRPLLAQIERRDRDLGRQLRRASSSVALNLAEGMYSQGQLRTGDDRAKARRFDRGKLDGVGVMDGQRRDTLEGSRVV